MQGIRYMAVSGPVSLIKQKLCNARPSSRSFLLEVEMAEFDEHLNTAWWVLRVGLGVGPIITGIDKYFNKLADWGMYLSPLATKTIPVSTATFMHIVGVVEILAGIVVLSKFTRWGAYIVMLWLIGIATNLALTGMFWDLAMRDIEIALGAFALAQLSVVREEQSVSVRGKHPQPVAVNH
jgi:hypothetical protein